MKLCPIAIAAGCRKCPLFSVCPLKGVIGDYKEEAEDSQASEKSEASAAEDEEKG